MPFSKSSINQPWHYTALGQSGETTLAIRHFYLFILGCITKSPQTLVKWAFQDTIKNSLHTFLPYFKHFLKIFVIHSVDLCHIKPLIIVLYFHLFFYTIYRNLCIVKKNAYKACNINVCREFLFINSFVIYTIYRNVSAVNKKSCNLSKIKGFGDFLFQTFFPYPYIFSFLLHIKKHKSDRKKCQES